MQMAPQIRLVQNNDVMMSDKIQSTLVNTIPLWKSQMVIALGIQHSQDAAKAQKEVTELTNKMLKENAENLKMATIETAKESERGIVDIETLTETNKKLIETLEEVKRIQTEGREKRLAAQTELRRIETQLQHELTHMYELVNKLFIICIRRELKLIVENPYSEEHYLRRYWCLPATLIDRDSRQRGDYYKKPTQYWFVNCKPKHNFLFEPMAMNAIQVKDPIRMMKKEDLEKCGITVNKKVARSMIHPDYANRFIREFILAEESE